VAAEEERGGGAYRQRDCSIEVVEDVGEVLRVTAICGSPSGMVGVGRSTCAGGDAHRRRGIRPANDAIVQVNRSESFARGQEGQWCKELENGSLDCSAHARRRAAEVRRG
jgi:ribosomal protein S5